MNSEYRLEILKSSLEGRIREVTEYQVNIDNFTLAIEAVGDDPELAEFRLQLEDLLRSSRLEQRKAQVMLDVIQKQVEL
jgi:hypothetical protein